MRAKSCTQSRLKSRFRNPGPEQTQVATHVELHPSTWAINRVHKIAMAVTKKMDLLVTRATPQQIVLLRLHKRAIDQDIQQPE